MTGAERAQILLTARLLRAAGKIGWLSTGLTLIAAASIVFGTSNRIAGIGVIVLGIIAAYYGLRIALDARLLEDVAEDRMTTEDLDRALVALGLAPQDNVGRSWSDRCRGAKRLAIMIVLVTILQCVAIMLMGVCGGAS